MKFTIRRASNWDDERPHKSAYQLIVRKTSFKGRTKAELEWFVDIDTIEDLKALSDENCERFVVDFKKYCEDDKYPSITIYDGYIE